MCIFMKGINDLLIPLLDMIEAPSELIAHPQFDYTKIIRLASLQATIPQYPPELQYIMGDVHITDVEGLKLMAQLSNNNRSAGSDRSVKDGICGHSFYLTDNNSTTRIWGYDQTVGHSEDMTSLRAEHGGALGILLLLL